MAVPDLRIRHWCEQIGLKDQDEREMDCVGRVVPHPGRGGAKLPRFAASGRAAPSFDIAVRMVLTLRGRNRSSMGVGERARTPLHHRSHVSSPRRQRRKRWKRQRGLGGFLLSDLPDAEEAGKGYCGATTAGRRTRASIEPTDSREGTARRPKREEELVILGV